MAVCRSCKAPIIFVTSENGRSMPLDPVSEKRVVIVTRAAGPGEPDQQVGRVVSTYQSHFASCPNASQHRKGKPT